MSLINEMLKDLEMRQGREQRTHHIPLFEKHVPTIEHSSLLKFLSVIPLLFVFGLIYFYLVHSVPHKKMHDAAIIPQQKNFSNAAPISDQQTAWLEPVAITGITLQVKDNMTELAFLLKHAALYHITSNESQHEFSITLERAKLESELPPVKYLTTAISHMEVKQVGKDLQFKLVLQPGAAVKYANLEDADKNPQLTIAIAYAQKTPDIETSLENNAVKTQALQSLLSGQYHAALAALDSGQLQLAIERLTSLIKIAPEFQKARVSLAAILLNQGEQIKANMVINAGLQLNPSFTPLIELKARIMTDQGKIGEALALLQSASPAMNDDPDYHAFMAALYDRLNHHQLAMGIYQQLLKIDPHNGNWWFGLGVVLEKLGRPKNALSAYTKAQAEGNLSPNSSTVLQTRLEALGDANNA